MWTRSANHERTNCARIHHWCQIGFSVQCLFGSAVDVYYSLAMHSLFCFFAMLRCNHFHNEARRGERKKYDEPCVTDFPAGARHHFHFPSFSFGYNRHDEFAAANRERNTPKQKIIKIIRSNVDRYNIEYFSRRPNSDFIFYIWKFICASNLLLCFRVILAILGKKWRIESWASSMWRKKIYIYLCGADDVAHRRLLPRKCRKHGKKAIIDNDSERKTTRFR